MSAILDPEIAVQYNWYRKKGKKVFSTIFTSIELVIGIVLGYVGNSHIRKLWDFQFAPSWSFYSGGGGEEEGLSLVIYIMYFTQLTLFRFVISSSGINVLYRILDFWKQTISPSDFYDMMIFLWEMLLSYLVVIFDKHFQLLNEVYCSCSRGEKHMIKNRWYNQIFNIWKWEYLLCSSVTWNHQNYAMEPDLLLKSWRITYLIGVMILTTVGCGQIVGLPEIPNPIILTDCPFLFKRVQFPIKLSFANIINKGKKITPVWIHVCTVQTKEIIRNLFLVAQSQSSNVVGLNLVESCFPHSQYKNNRAMLNNFFYTFHNLVKSSL